ncbi:MAG: hypothetical protein ACXWDN_13375 [Limisphaerales bacterium]
MITTNQMELGFEQQQLIASAGTRNSRQTRADWWFKQMRRVVDVAMEWRPAPRARHQQSYMVLSARQS